MKDRAGSLVGTLAGVAFVAAALPLMVGFAPLLTVGATIWDVATGRWRLPTVRLYAFAVVYLAHEWWGLFHAARLVLTGQGRHREPWADLQDRWLASLLGTARVLLGVTIEMPPIDLPDGRFILVSRHASAADAVLPSYLINTTNHRPVHYVLKAELGLDPCLGIVGRRLHNHFLRRGANRERELAAIAEMGHGALPRSGCVIFPEGTYATAANRARVLASLEAKGPSEALSVAAKLRHLLPPKPAGVATLLAAMPDADVVFVAHAGLEGVAEFEGLRRRLPLNRPVVADSWVVPRGDIPDDPDDQADWLNSWWIRLDQWVDDRLDRQPVVGRRIDNRLTLKRTS